MKKLEIRLFSVKISTRKSRIRVEFSRSRPIIFRDHKNKCTKLGAHCLPLLKHLKLDRTEEKLECPKVRKRITNSPGLGFSVAR